MKSLKTGYRYTWLPDMLYLVQILLIRQLRYCVQTGSSTVNAVTSSTLSAVILPPWSVTMSFAMASPNPAPPIIGRTGFVQPEKLFEYRIQLLGGNCFSSV